MTATPVPGFPNAAQGPYAPIPKAPLAGSLFSEELWNAQPRSVILPRLDEVAFSKTLTIGNSTADGDVGISVAGGEIVITPSGNNTTDATALDAAIRAAGFAWKVYIDDSVPAAAVVTITGILGQDPEITAVQDGSTTLVIAIPTAAVVQLESCFGEALVVFDAGGGINTNLVRRPTSLTDRFAGVLLRTTGSLLPAGQLHEYDPTQNPDEAVPGQCYDAETKDVGVMVDYIGTAPTPLDDVYSIMIGTGAGKWAASDGGVSQVTRGDVEFNGVEVVGLAVDALPDLTVLSNTSDDQTAADLRDAWNGSAQHLAVAVATIDTSGAESFIDLAFVDTAAHTVVSVSPATADVVGIINTATAVALNAVLRADYSWDRASIIATVDEPGRAYLRLSR